MFIKRTSIKSMITASLSSLACFCLLSVAGAVEVPVDSNGDFSLSVAPDQFTDWAMTNDATKSTVEGDDFQTFTFTEDEGYGATHWYSGPTTANKWGSIHIPFHFSQAPRRVRLEYGAVCRKYGYNWGRIYIEVETPDGTKTRIFCMKADSTDPSIPNYNYTTAQTPGEGAGQWRGYTDITDLVAGQTSFILHINVNTGDSGVISNGALFLPDFWPDSNFKVTSQAVATDVPITPNGQFSVTGPAATFTDWAVARGATADNFVTHQIYPDPVYMGSGAPNANTGGSLTIPFTFEKPLLTARLDFSSCCHSYGANGGNWGYTKLELITDTGITKIFCQKADSLDPALDFYNYTTSQTPALGWWKGYTDISPLVAGKSEFALRITSLLGESGWIYNGGNFLPQSTALNSTFGTDQDFHLTGTVVGYKPITDVPINNDSTFSLRGPANGFTSWAVARGATPTSFTTFQNGDLWLSGNSTPGGGARLEIPFTFEKPLATARLDYGAICLSYVSNWGYVGLDIVTDAGTTEIYRLKADSTDPARNNYNYTTSQTPAGKEAWRGYTDISQLVAGKKAFTLVVLTESGESGWTYNGGQFLPSQWTDSDFYLTGTTSGPKNVSVSGTKTGNDGDEIVLDSGIVTAVFGDDFYIESENKESGVMVTRAGSGVAIGDKVSVSGTLQSNANGERYIQATNVTKSGAGSITPVAMNNKTVGGGEFGNQQGVDGGNGVNTIGLLVKTFGTLTNVNSSTFTIDDGSGVNIKCVVPSEITIEHWLHTYACVAGISSCEVVNGKLVRVIKLRDANDFYPMD